MGLQDFLLTLLYLKPEDVTDTPVQFVALQSLDEVEYSLQQLMAAWPRQQLAMLPAMPPAMQPATSTAEPLGAIRSEQAQTVGHLIKSAGGKENAIVVRPDGPGTPSPMSTVFFTPEPDSGSTSNSNGTPYEYQQQPPEFVKEAAKMIATAAHDGAHDGAHQAFFTAAKGVNERFDSLQAEFARAADAAEQREKSVEGAPPIST